MIDRLGSVAFNPLAAYSQLPRTTAAAPRTALSGAFGSDDSQLEAAQRSIVRLSRALDDLAQTLRGGRTSSSAQAPSATSAGSLSLSAVSSAARVESTAELNTVTTSYTPFGPSFQGSSTALATIGGTYAGAADDTFTFTVRTTAGAPSAAVGVDRAFIDVTNSAGTKVDSLKFDNTTPAGTQFSLASGLRLTIGAGALANGDKFTVNAYASIDSAIDPTKPFNGTRNSSPNLQPGLSVTNGSFTVNGASIAVSASDSLNTVLARINSSAAGVTASYDGTTERVSIVQNSAGADYTVALGADSSGFLAAAKLDRNQVTPGTGDELHDPMSTIAELSGISAGAFTVNGKSISVDPAVDSLTALLSRIEGSGAGVTASYSEGTGLVTIKNTDASLPLSLSSGSTGLFPALGITDGTRTPQTATGRGLSASRAARVADAMESVANELSRLFDSSEGAPARVGTLRSTLREAVTEALDTDKDRARTSFGVTFDFRGGRRNVFSFDDQDRESLVRQLRQNPDVVRQLFFGDGPDDEQSLGNLFLGALDDARRDIGRELGRTGVFVNAIA